MTARSPVVSVILSVGRMSDSVAVERTRRAIERQSLPAVEMLVCGPAAEYTSLPMAAVGRFVPVIVDAPCEGAVAWNAALPQASGEYVCCLLSGDDLAPTYLEKCLFHTQIGGFDAGSVYEQPSDTLPHICVVRKRVLQHLGGYDVKCPPEEQRIDLVRRLLDNGFVRAEVPEVLVQPFESPVGSRPLDLPPLPGINPQPRFSYAPLVTGWPQQRPTILLAMPFLTVGGAEASVSQICRQIKELGFRILVYTTVPVLRGQGDTTSWFEDSAIGIYHLPRFLDIEFWPAFIAYLVQQHDVSALWLVGSTYTYNLLTNLKELFPQLAIVDLLFNSVAHVASYMQYNYLIDRLVTEHGVMKEWLVERGEDTERISVIPNGVDLHAYSPAAKLDWRTRQPRRVGDTRFVVVFLGRLSEEKGPDVFLEIAARLANDQNFEFLVCGGGPMERSLRWQATLRGLAERVHFLGLVPGRDYLPCCDAVIVCSRLDGRPNIIMESLAMGVPVIASRVGGIPEMMPPDQGELLCESGDVDAFVAAIRLLASDSHRYRQAAETARQHAEKHFSGADSGYKYAKLFTEIAGKREALDRCIAPEAVAARLGYKRKWRFVTVPPRKPRFWQAYSPRSSFAHLKNALLLWRLRRSGRKEKLLGYFDVSYYERQVPKGRPQDHWPLLHYIFFGFREGRNPTAHFDTRFYLTANPDVRRAGVNPLLHYVMWGENEGRFATARSGDYSAPSRTRTD